MLQHRSKREKLWLQKGCLKTLEMIGKPRRRKSCEIRERKAILEMLFFCTHIIRRHDDEKKTKKASAVNINVLLFKCYNNLCISVDYCVHTTLYATLYAIMRAAYNRCG